MSMALRTSDGLKRPVGNHDVDDDLRYVGVMWLYRTQVVGLLVVVGFSHRWLTI